MPIKLRLKGSLKVSTLERSVIREDCVRVIDFRNVAYIYKSSS